MHPAMCEVCAKSLLDEPGPVLMDKQGLRYHLACWCHMIDVLVQEQRERLAAAKARLDAAQQERRERLAKAGGPPDSARSSRQDRAS